MKELHNHIFSNTTCISKETMLKYINHQLSVKELHEVEKHMLDCELCSDAIEGLKYAQNSSLLFAIDHEIDQRVRTGYTKKPIMRNLMVAASLLIVVFGSYFTFDYFNTTVDQNAGLALNTEEESLPQEEDVRKEGELKELATEKATEQSGADYWNNQEQNNAASGAVVLEDEESEETDTRSNMDLAPAPVSVVEEVADAEEALGSSYSWSNQAQPEDNHNDRDDSTVELAKTLNEVSADRKKNDKAEEKVALQVTATSSSKDANFGFTDNVTGKGNTNNTNKNRKKEVTKQKAQNTRASSEAPAFKSVEDDLAGMLEQPLEDLPGDGLETITLSDYKVVDYTDAYQQEYDKLQAVEVKSVTANYETQQEAEEAEREMDEITVEITYKTTLEKAMAYYKAQKYTLALDQFNVILQEHPDEVNGLFYGGLSNYHLGRFEKAEGELNKVLVNPKKQFNQEAEWYKALTLIELKKTEEAKKLLQKIATAPGFYQTRAKEKLKNW
ncbi:MAG: tetratricopeptide repeat protein [Flavobacteriales bacterium]|nr:tetratricopeptide repeat protein [Flavobacteriales bacterium]